MELSRLVLFLIGPMGGGKKKGRWHVRDPIMVVHGGVWAFSHASSLQGAPPRHDLLYSVYWFASGHRCILYFLPFLYLTVFFFSFGLFVCLASPLPPHSVLSYTFLALSTAWSFGALETRGITFSITARGIPNTDKTGLRAEQFCFCISLFLVLSSR